MSVGWAYLVDSDVFITAKDLYYPFDICPGFWKSLLHHHRAGRVYSTDRVRSELLAGRKTEDLVQWVRSEVPGGFFLPVDTADVADAYTNVIDVGPAASEVFRPREGEVRDRCGRLAGGLRTGPRRDRRDERAEWRRNPRRKSSCLICVLSSESGATTRSPCFGR